MKLRDNFILRQVAGSWVVVPVGEASVDFNGMLSLNESGALLWKTLEQSGDLQKTLTETYHIAPDEAARDIQEFLESLRAAGCLES